MNSEKRINDGDDGCCLIHLRAGSLEGSVQLRHKQHRSSLQNQSKKTEMPRIGRDKRKRKQMLDMQNDKIPTQDQALVPSFQDAFANLPDPFGASELPRLG